MAKKFYDIVPPDMVKKSGAKSKGIRSVVKKGAPAAKFSRRAQKDGMPARSKAILAGVCVVIVIVLVYLYLKLPYLSVDVQPKTQSTSLSQQITPDKTVTAVDLQNKKIPAKIITEENEIWQEFPATGSASNAGVATGTITVYNKYSPATDLNLRAKTRFISDSGKYFVSTGKILVPAAQIINGKVVPGQVDVKVKAVESGADYNVGPSNFAIPGLVGTALYSSVYGVSTASMSGGFASTSKLVTASDIADAKTALSKKVLDSVTQSLKDKAGTDGLVVFDSAITKNITEDAPSVKAGAQVDNFNYKIKAKVSALVFLQSDLKQYTNDYTLSQIPKDQAILEKTFSLNYAPSAIDLQASKMTLQLKISADTYQKVDIKALEASLEGKNSAQISDIVGKDFNQQISELKINLWPFWVTKGPANPDRIKVNLIFQ